MQNLKSNLLLTPLVAGWVMMSAATVSAQTGASADTIYFRRTHS